MTRALNKAAFAAVALLAVSAFVLTIMSTAQGIGLYPDSLGYWRAAREFAQTGHLGLTHFPPLLPSLLALLQRLDLPALLVMRWLHAGIFFLFTASVGFCLWRLTHSVLLTALGSAWALTNQDLLHLHATLLSEPLFFLFGGFGLWCLSLKKPHVIWAGIWIALASLTRYAGAALILTGVMYLWLFQPDNAADRRRNALVFIGIAALPLALWIFYGWLTVHSLADRQLHFHPPGIVEYIFISNSILGWFSPLDLDLPLLALVILGAISVVLWRARQDLARHYPRQALLFACFAAMYAVFIWISFSFFDAHLLDRESRNLAPIFLSGLIALIPALQIAFTTRRARVIACACIISLTLLHCVAAWQQTSAAQRHGIGYAGLAWKDSPLMASIKKIPGNTPLFTNGPEVVEFYAERSAQMLPVRRSPGTLQDNPSFNEEVAHLQGAIAIFRTIGWRGYLASEDDLARKLPLSVVEKTRDGVLYRVDGLGTPLAQ